jgi:hypothetical protein
VVVTSVCLEDPRDGRRLFQPRPLPGATLPGVIPPRGSGHAWFNVVQAAAEHDGFEYIDTPLVGCVQTAAGEVFRTKPTVMMTSGSEGKAA